MATEPETIDLDYPKISSDLFEQNIARDPEEEGYPEGTTSMKLLALDTAFKLREKNPSLFEKNEDPYKALASGKAKFIPEEQRDQVISDAEIIRRYLRNPDNQPMREGSYTKGFTKKIGPSVGGLAGTVYGVKAGYAMQTPIPPVGPFAVAAKFLIPVATGIAGAMGGEKAIQEVRDYFFGEPDLVDPEKGASEERVGETAAIATSFAPLPFITTREALSFGAEKVLGAIALEKAKKIERMNLGPIQDAAGIFKKAPLSTRLIEKAERAIPEMGRAAKARPGKQAIIEGSFVAGATAGKGFSEEYLDGDYGIASEIVGGLGAALALPTVIGAPYYIFTNASAVGEGLKKVQRAFSGKPENKDIGFKDLFRINSGGASKAEVDVANIIEERLIEAGEDPEKIAEVIEKIINDPKFKNFTSGTLSQSPTLLRIEHEMAELFPDLRAQGQESVKAAVDNYKQLLVAFAMVGDSSALRQVEGAFQDLIERGFIDQLGLSAKKVLAAAEKVGAGETDASVGKALKSVLSQSLTAARAKEKSLYARLPQTEISVFRSVPEEGQEVGEIRELPNLFDWLDSLPDSRTSLKFSPEGIKKQISFILEILDNAGVDTSRLGKRGVDAGDSDATKAAAKVESRLQTLANNRQGILDNLSQTTKNLMRSTLDLLTENSTYVAASADDQVSAASRDLNAVDTLIEATRGRRNIGPEEFRMEDLKQIKALVRNRLATARARVDSERVPVPQQSGPEDQLANEIVDLRLLVDQLRESGQPISITSGLLNEMRTAALSADRELTASGKYNEARLLKKIAQLVDQDLIGSIEDLAGPEAKAAFTAARAFTVGLNNVFTRASAPANLLGTRSTGAEALSPEEAIRDLFTGRTDRVLRNSREITRVGQFLRDEVNPDIELVEGLGEGIDVGRLVNDIPDVMERAIRNIRSSVLKPRTGEDAGSDLTLNVKELRDWMQDPNNKELLAMFPRQLTDDLNETEAAYEMLLTARNQAATGRKEAKARLSFKRLLDRGDETPSATISEALGGQRPAFELNQIWRTISQSGVESPVRQEARDSLKTGLLDWAIAKASNQNGDLNPKRMYDNLFRPIRPGSSITVAEWMTSKGLLTKKGADDIQTYLAEMTSLESLLTKEGIDALIKSGNSPLRDLSLRIIGAKLGTSVSGLIGGSEASLIAAAAGSRALRAMFVSKSGVNNMKAFKKLLEDPEFLAKMLRVPKNKREEKSMIKAAREWMLSKGFVLGRRLYTAEQTEQEEFDGLPPRTLEELTEKTGRFEMLPVSLPKQEQPDPLTLAPESPTTVSESQPAPQVEPQLESELAAAQREAMRPTVQPAPDPMIARVAQTPTNLSSPKPRGTSIDTRREFEAMQEELAGAGKIPAQQLGELTIDQQLDAPLSIKNNNPGNLRMAGQPGAEEGLEGFASFSTPGQGVNALTRQIVLDTQTRGLTLGEFITKYAPPSENDTEGYIRFMEQKTGVTRDKKVPDFLVPDIARAIVEFEGGKLAVRYFFGDRIRAEAAPAPQPPIAQAAPPAPPAPAPVSPQSLQRAAQVLGPQDDIGMLASEMLMRQRPA